MNKLVILMIIAIIIIVLIVIMYSQKLPSTSSSSIKPNSTSTTSKSVTTTAQSNTASTTIPSTNTINSSNTASTTIPSTNTAANSLNYSFISDINIEFIYTGPATNSSNVNCNYYNNTIPYTFNNHEKPKSSFDINLTISTSSSCGLTIRNMSSLTNGFKIFSTNPVLPYYIPGHNSQALMQINLTTPAYNFSGPVSIIIHEI